MTEQQSEQIEDLLEQWHHWCRAQREFLGHSRVSPMFRDADSSDVHNDGEDTDARLHSITAEMVDACVGELTVYERAAIELHCRNVAAGNSVHRNPRLGDIQEQHIRHQRAKDKLLPLLIRKGLVNREPARLYG